MEQNRIIYFSFGYQDNKISKDHVFLSNFFESTFTEDGKQYKTVEHYFQSKKFLDQELEMLVVNSSSPRSAKRLGRINRIDSEWWNSVRNSTMKNALGLKFTQNDDLKNKLLETNDAKLIEFSKSDRYWGGSLKGSRNMLGIMLMELRSLLRKNN